jgi:ATP-dependent RNA helicase DeaD
VATDVAARGLDMPDLGLVIHADLPQNRQALLHRSGRTGRAGRKGLSVMLVPVSQKFAAERLLSAAKVKAVWSPAPSADQIRARDEKNLVQEIVTMAEAPAEEDLAVGRALLEERSAEQLAAVLVRLKRENLPAPEVIEDPGTYKKEPWKAKQRSRPVGPWVRDEKGTRGPARKSWGRSERPERNRTERPVRAERPFQDRTERPKFERTARPARPVFEKAVFEKPVFEKAARPVRKAFDKFVRPERKVFEGVERADRPAYDRSSRPPRPRNKKKK